MCRLCPMGSSNLLPHSRHVPVGELRRREERKKGVGVGRRDVRNTGPQGKVSGRSDKGSTLRPTTLPAMLLSMPCMPALHGTLPLCLLLLSPLHRSRWQMPVVGPLGCTGPRPECKRLRRWPHGQTHSWQFVPLAAPQGRLPHVGAAGTGHQPGQDHPCRAHPATSTWYHLACG